MSKHTPAPWELCQLPPASWTYIQDKNYKVIASVGEWNENGELNRFHGDRPVLEAKANAQLIAAAPELLEIIQDIYNHYYFEGNFNLKDETKEKLEQVIKKAKGDNEE